MQKRNYQKELDAIIAEDEKKGIRPRLLIHSCCAPCSSYVMEYLRKSFDLSMYFYNPNMDSAEEYDKRAAELRRLIDELNAEDPEHLIHCFIEDYDPERGARCMLCYELRLRKTAEFMEAHNAACGVSSDTAAAAAAEQTCQSGASSTFPACGDRHSKSSPALSSDSVALSELKVSIGEAPFDYFASTLSLSPLKNAEALNSIAEQIAEQKHLQALPNDFKKREGYKRSIELSAKYGLYRQNYCGCRFSKAEAAEREHKKS